MSIRILSFDVSTVSTGWCIYIKDKLHDMGKINIKDTIDIHERMVILRDRVEELIKKHKPNVVIVEDVWLGKNPKTAKTLSKFCGIVEELSCRMLKNKPVVIENTKVKNFFMCKTKEMVFDFVIDLLELDYNFKEDNDKIDAVAQLICYLDLYEKANIRIKKDYGYLYDFGG